MSVKHVPGCIVLILACASAIAQKSGPHWQPGGIDGVTVLLYAGEQVFGVWKSKTPGDYLQTTNQTYVQIERWK